MSRAERRRVLFLASSAPRFAGDPTAPFILNMARDLGELGWDVQILAPHAPGLKRRESIEGVAIRRFRYLWPARLQTLCYGGGAAVNLKRNRWNLLAVPFMVLAEFISALVIVLRWRPALIHSHWVIPQGLVGQVLSWFGPRHVISVHGADVYGFRGRVMLSLKRWALRRCAHVVANSSSTRAEILALCGPRALSVVPTGTTPHGPDQPPKGREAFAPPGACLILFVGRLIPAKGVRYLIEAMPQILAGRPANLVIVGEGPERAALESLAHAMNLGHCVTFVGAVPHAQVHHYYAMADVFVGPSITIPGEWTEAQGNTFVEALFARVPVVASRVGGIPDAIIHERTGLLVDERAPAQIAAAVERVVQDPGLAAALKEAGYVHAMNGFSRYQSAARLDSLYRQVLSR